MDENLLTRKILKERTKLLAKTKQNEASLKNGMELIIFILGSERYGLEAKLLKSIRALPSYIPLPGVQPFIKGITNLFGVLYTIIDLKVFLNLNTGEEPLNSQLLVIDHETLKICFLVDKIIEFKTISEDDLETNITGIKSLEDGVIKGISSETISVFNLDKLLEKIRRDIK